MPRVIISGGGTGGHVFPAIAIADAIKAAAPDTEILFVGANGKIEMEKVPKAGYKIEGLNITGFQRKLTLRNLSFPFKLAASMLKAVMIVRKFRPDVAVGVGGYASGPVLKIANTFGIPTVLQEQNSFAGVTNRILASKANAVCVAYDGLERFFPKDKIIFTGNPVRKDILDKKINAEQAKQSLGLDQNKKTVLIFGGSLGARTINEAVLANADALLGMKDVNIIWQVGKIYFEEYKNCRLSGQKDINIIPFIEDMDMAYSAADIVVCRAGALTISELAILGKAAILIPSPNVAEDHQTVNAMSLVNKGAAVLIRDVEAKEKLVTEIESLLSDEVRKSGLESNIKYFARPEAAKQIAAEILKICAKKGA
ncbi:MAG: undecaprenyldiphospho-muramoylpentapeptide beta-N-acetylglucosaminyltransferase [Saprospiraceae bacterium]|nr:undecaprenyldiphospho-muramoylpentapeptide beta-N-acetylglucosaminyltransferase [Saprospiraceae bacterium]MBP6567876.1 undecaprenyldiphospho-muramoylpentapeptide beta-N-acetylglucosaminyltransferase [Saprospiraceae bacterium]